MKRAEADRMGWMTGMMLGLCLSFTASAQTPQEYELVVICGTAAQPQTTPKPGAIPEPATIGLLLIGLLLAVGLRKRVRRHHLSLFVITLLCAGSLFLLGQTSLPETFFLIKPGSGGGIVTVDGTTTHDPTMLKSGLEFVNGRSYMLRARPEPDSTFSGWKKNGMPVTSPAYVQPGERIAADFSVIPDNERQLRLQLSPNDLFASEAKDVTITVDLSHEQQSEIARVIWQIVDFDGNVLTVLGELKDDGNPAHGDDAANDGMFSATVNLGFPVKQHVYVNVRVYSGNDESHAQTVTLPVYNHLTHAEFTGLLQTIDEAQTEYRRLKASMGNETAVAQVVDVLRKKPDVIEVGNERPGGSIWILYNPGIIGGLHIEGAKTRGLLLNCDEACEKKKRNKRKLV